MLAPVVVNVVLCFFIFIWYFIFCLSSACLFSLVSSYLVVSGGTEYLLECVEMIGTTQCYLRHLDLFILN